MSKKEYVLREAKEFDPQSFYVHFGFKTRLFAEDELKNAVKSAYEQTNDESLKNFLYEEYIRTDFQILTGSTHLDIYWTDTVREVISMNMNKRKLNHVLSLEPADITKRSAKDHRTSQTLTNKKIFDLECNFFWTDANF